MGIFLAVRSYEADPRAWLQRVIFLKRRSDRRERRGRRALSHDGSFVGKWRPPSVENRCSHDRSRRYREDFQLCVARCTRKTNLIIRRTRIVRSVVARPRWPRASRFDLDCAPRESKKTASEPGDESVFPVDDFQSSSSRK